MKKSLEEIIDEIDEKCIYQLQFYPKKFALQVAKTIRKLTLEEVAAVAEVGIIDIDLDNNPVWGVDSDSILKLDLKNIQIW